jgi:hypothetical protein
MVLALFSATAMFQWPLVPVIQNIGPLRSARDFTNVSIRWATWNPTLLDPFSS